MKALPSVAFPTTADPAALMSARAKSFNAAARFLPTPHRDAVRTLYQFCRVVDDIADDPARDDATALAELDQIAAWVDTHSRRAVAGPGPLTPLARLIAERDLDRRLLGCLVGGVRSDRLRQQRDDWADLQRYCFQVAGSVGMLMAQLFGIRETAGLHAAATLGVAMQLTNIIRDVGEDLERGLVYLPATVLARFGYDRARLERRTVDDAFVALVQWHIARAREHYAAGLAGLHWLPPDVRFAIALAARLYAAILDEVERNGYDVFSQRAATSPLRKARLAATTYGGLRLAGWLGRSAWPSGGDSLGQVASVVGQELGKASELTR